MGNYDDLIRDIAQAVAGVRDSITTDVGALVGESLNAENHVTKVFKSETMKSYRYVLDTVTGEVNQMAGSRIVDYIGNILTDVGELTIPTDPSDPCVNVPPIVNINDAMNLHKSGRNFNIRKIGGQLFIDMDTGCRRPYEAVGSKEALRYFYDLKTVNIYYEFTPDMFTEPTPHAKDEQPTTVVQTTTVTKEINGVTVTEPAAIVWVWNPNNLTWRNKETGEVFTPTRNDKVSTVQAGWLAPSPEPYNGYPLWASQAHDKLYSSSYLDVLADPGAVTNWSSLITGKNPVNGRVMLFWEKDTPIPTVKTTSDTIASESPLLPSGGYPVSTPTTTTTTTATGKPIKTGDATLDAFAALWYGNADNLNAYNDPLKTIFDELGIEAPKSVIDWVNIAIMTLIGTFARLSNEPLDRVIRYNLNKQMPNAIPNPTDLVRFELREVYRDVDRAESLKVPPSTTFKDYMRKWGFNDYESESYWAAHWELPSPIQAYEMFHRLRPGEFTDDVAFDESALKKTLQILDYRPDFIERLIQIAYQPITRVDIRRMWSMGVIKTEEDLYRRYLDLGYKPDDAAVMVDFTIKSSQPETKTLPKSFYEDEFEADRLTYEELVKAYELMGYQPEDGRRMADSLLLKKQRTTQAETERRATGARSDKMLTADQTLKAFKLGIIEEEVALHKLIRYGYDQKDANILLDIAYIELSDEYAVSKQLETAERRTITDILNAFISGESDETTARSELAGIGKREAEINALINVAKAQRR